MRRKMTASMLHDYLSSAHTTLMLCKAHAEEFLLSNEEAQDAAFQITLSIAELEDLQVAIQSVLSVRDNAIFLPVYA